MASAVAQSGCAAWSSAQVATRSSRKAAGAAAAQGCAPRPAAAAHRQQQRCAVRAAAAAAATANGAAATNGSSSNGGGESTTPSAAETARTVVDLVAHGTLCTVGEDGIPLGTYVTYVLDDAGQPILRLRADAVHTANLSRDSKCSLFVQPGEHPARLLARVTLIGAVEPVGPGGWVAGCWLAGWLVWLAGRLDQAKNGRSHKSVQHVLQDSEPQAGSQRRRLRGRCHGSTGPSGPGSPPPPLPAQSWQSRRRRHITRCTRAARAWTPPSPQTSTSDWPSTAASTWEASMAGLLPTSSQVRGCSCICAACCRCRCRWCLPAAAPLSLPALPARCLPCSARGRPPALHQSHSRAASPASGDAYRAAETDPLRTCAARLAAFMNAERVEDVLRIRWAAGLLMQVADSSCCWF